MTYSTISLSVFIFIFIGDIVTLIDSFGSIRGSTELMIAFRTISLIGLFMLAFKTSWKNLIPKESFFIYKLFMAYSFFSFIHGGINAQDYWDWKFLLLRYAPSIFIALAIVAGLNYEMSIKIFRFILNRIFLFSFVFVPISLKTDYLELYARAVMPVSLLLLCVPYLRFKWRTLVVIVAIFSFAVDISYRTNVLRLILSISILCLYFSRRIISVGMLNIFLCIIFCAPLVFLYLGSSGQFNIFSENPIDYKVNEGMENAPNANLADDTRTFLYREVYNSMVKRDSSFLFGEGGGAAYDSDFFASENVNARGRYGSEVGFLNTLLCSGIIGVLLYALILFYPAYYGINFSNNFLCKMLGLSLITHWPLFFIEEIPRMDMHFYCIWLVIGLCLSNKFRTLTDAELRQFFILNTKKVSRNNRDAVRRV